MIAIPNLEKRKPVPIKIIDGILFTLSIAAITFGAIAPRLITQPSTEPYAQHSAFADANLRLEISTDPLLGIIGSEQFQHQQRRWAEAQAFKELSSAQKKAAAMISEATNSATATAQEAERLASASAFKQNYAVATFQLHRPLGHEYRTQVETIIETTETSVGCDVLLTQYDDSNNQALMTGLASGSCPKDGVYPKGFLIGIQGENPVGRRIY